MSNNLLENPYVDITANNHGGNEQSQEANKLIAPYKASWRERILGLMAIRDAEGLGTSRRHACDYFDKELGQIGGRFTELKIENIIEETHDIDRGCMIYRLTGSTKVAINEVKVKRCLVVGAGLIGEILLHKGPGGWQIATITPNLKPIVADTPIPDIGKRLSALHLTYSWID